MRKWKSLIVLGLTATGLVGCTIPGTTPQAASETSAATTAPTPTVSENASPETAELDLESVVRAVQEKFPGDIGIALSDGTNDMTGGSTEAVPAWSTSKVPLAIAALRNNPQQSPAVTAAITRSDNDSAQQLWDSLGEPSTAAHLVSQVLAEGGVDAQVQSTVVRPGFSAFGQTLLSPAQEAHFAANLSCVQGSEHVTSLMGNIDSDQSYGMGSLPGAAFKGGWGPTPEGGYEARQMGTVETDHGRVALALWVKPQAGDYGTAQQALSALAQELQPLLGKATPIAENCR